MDGCSGSRGVPCSTQLRCGAAPLPPPPPAPFRPGPCVGDRLLEGVAPRRCMAAECVGGLVQAANLENMCVDVRKALLSLEVALGAPKDPEAIDEQLSAAFRTTAALDREVGTLLLLPRPGTIQPRCCTPLHAEAAVGWATHHGVPYDKAIVSWTGL